MLALSITVNIGLSVICVILAAWGISTWRGMLSADQDFYQLYDKAVQRKSADRKLLLATRAGLGVMPLPKRRAITPRAGVYVIRCQDMYKIGQSTDTAERIKSLSTGMPGPYEVVHVIASNAPWELERQLHKQFAHCRVRGEWFNLTPADIAAIRACGVDIRDRIL